MGSSWKEARLTVAREGMSDGVAGWMVKGIFGIARLRLERFIFIFTFLVDARLGGLAKGGEAVG